MVLELKRIRKKNSLMGNSKVVDVLEAFGQNLTISINPFQDVYNYMKAEKNLRKLEKELEDICKTHPQELKAISPDYHKPALKLLGYSLRAVYALRDSQTSRELDKCANFARLLDVPNLDYIDVVLENTPRSYLQNELEDQLKTKHLSEKELKKLLDKYHLKEPKILDADQHDSENNRPKEKPNKKGFYELLKSYFTK